MAASPVKIDQLFTKLLELVRQAESERSQLYLIRYFLFSIEGEYRKYDSYIIQLLQYFPDFDHLIVFTGINPGYLNECLELVHSAAGAIPLLQSDEELRLKINRLEEGRNLVLQWLGEYEHSEVGRQLVPELHKLPGVAGTATDVNDYSNVLIPVVELSGLDSSSAGRLRNLRVALEGPSRMKSYQLKPIFGVAGRETAYAGRKAAQLAGKLLEESVERPVKWTGQASFDLSHVWHSGGSADAAMAALFYSEMLRAEQKREFFTINPAIAITGGINPAGQIEEVNAESLDKKTEAVFYSWAQVFVVPLSQILQVSEKVKALNKLYPNRHLVIKGISDIHEIFYDRRLSLHHKLSLPGYTAKKLWKYRYSGVVMTLILLLLIITGYQIIGPIDKNPVSISYEGTEMSVYNKSGRLLNSFEVGALTVMGQRASEIQVYKRYAALIDINRDGINEIGWVSYENRDYSVLTFVNVDGDTLWEYSSITDFSYPEHPYINAGAHRISSIRVADYNKDNRDELFIVTADHQFFPSQLIILDVNRKTELFKYVHSGKIEEYELKDLNNDKIDEVIFTGVNNSFKNGVLGIIEIEENKLVQGSVSPRYYEGSLQKTDEPVYILFPDIIASDKYMTRSGFSNWPRGISINQLTNSFLVQIQENIDSNNPALIIYNFDFSMNPLIVGTNDVFDQFSNKVFEEGILKKQLNGKTLQTYMDSLRWWDGDKFITGRGPVFNKNSDFKIN